MDNPQIWWSDGLHFACLGCGRCCRGEPGAIWVSEEEEIIIAAWLNLSVEVFRNSYETRRWGPLSLKEKCGGDCIFYNREGARCSIYPVRPSQCSLFLLAFYFGNKGKLGSRMASLSGMNRGIYLLL